MPYHLHNISWERINVPSFFSEWSKTQESTTDFKMQTRTVNCKPDSLFSRIRRRTAYHCINSRERSHTETQTHTQTHRVSNSIGIPSTILPLTVRSSVEQFAEKKGLPVNYIKHKFSGDL